MTVHAIRACVDPKVIQTVTRLFNQSEGDIAAEMLQNTRRAGATRVIVSTTQLSHDRACLRISDNGRGLASGDLVEILPGMRSAKGLFHICDEHAEGAFRRVEAKLAEG